MVGRASELIQAQPGPQTEFLSCSADVVVYGGSAGGGKSWSLLLEAARHRKNPLFRGVLFRRTYRQIENPGGLLDESRNILPLLRGKWVGSRRAWEWPSGSSVQFAHLQHIDNREDWQGAQVAFVGWDELTHFDPQQFWYLLSRMRSMSGVRPYVRATCNPAPGWVREWLLPWVSATYDGPGGRAASGEVRWFVRRNGQIVWLIGDEKAQDGEEPISCTFIRSTIYDNKKLLERDPGYLAKLKALPETERRRLLDGDWDVFEGAFLPEWIESLHCVTPPYTPQNRPPAHWRWFGGLDWGYAVPFAFVLCATDEYGNAHVVETVQGKGLTNEAQADRVLACLARWGVHPRACPIAFDSSMRAQRTLNGIRGEADIEAFHRAGLMCAPSDRDRRAGWSVLRRWMVGRSDAGKPVFSVWRGYNAPLISMLPMAQFSERDPEDMDEDVSDGQGGHWDALQALRYAFRNRPRAATLPEAAKPRTPWQFDTTPSQPQQIR